MSEDSPPRIPFIWPAVLASGGSIPNATIPFEEVARSASSLFGVISAMDARAVEWLEGYLADTEAAQVRIVLSIHPICRTATADLHELLRLVERHGSRAAFRVYPERTLDDRSSNLLCCCANDGSAVIALGPTENLGFAPTTPSQANLVMTLAPTVLEVCRKWFDALWGTAGALRPEVATAMPKLALPQGELEGNRRWTAYRELCLNTEPSLPLATALAPPAPPLCVSVDPESGDVKLTTPQGETVATPTEELQVPKLDMLGAAMSRLFELGVLVAVDKASRVPPLEAPVKPEWFGLESFRNTGAVRTRTTIRVSAFESGTARKIENLRGVAGEVLSKYSFSLADGVRWMPRKAIPLFEAALSDANAAASQLLGTTLGADIAAFLATQRNRICADAQRTFDAYHPGETIPDSAVEHIMVELHRRLGGVRGEAILPKVSYSPVAFNPGQRTTWSSPWGQAFHLLKGIAEFPRKAMADPYFWRSVRASETALVEAMDVAGDVLVQDYGSRKARALAEQQLVLIEGLEASSAESREKCRALWSLISAGDEMHARKLTVPS